MCGFFHCEISSKTGPLSSDADSTLSFKRPGGHVVNGQKGRATRRLVRAEICSSLIGSVPNNHFWLANVGFKPWRHFIFTYKINNSCNYSIFSSPTILFNNNDNNKTKLSLNVLLKTIYSSEKKLEVCLHGSADCLGDVGSNCDTWVPRPENFLAFNLPFAKCARG